MKKILFAILTVATALSAHALSGDVNGDGEITISDVNAVIDIILSGDYSSPAADVNGDGEVGISDVNAVIDIILGGGSQETLTPKEITLDDSELVEPTEYITQDEDAPDYGDFVENTIWATTVNITFDGETATVTGNPSGVIASVNGAHVTITSAAKRVKYVVTGSTSNGSLKFYSERKFQLQLNGVDITNPNGAAVNNQCGKSLYLVVNAGTVNTLRDGDEYARARFSSVAKVCSIFIVWAAIAWPVMTMCWCVRVPNCTSTAPVVMASRPKTMSTSRAVSSTWKLLPTVPRVSTATVSSISRVVAQPSSPVAHLKKSWIR